MTCNKSPGQAEACPERRRGAGRAWFDPGQILQASRERNSRHSFPGFAGARAYIRYTPSMRNRKPAWLPEAQGLCRSAGIKIVGWGPDSIVVEAESPDRAGLVVSQLRPLGFQLMESEDDASAGLLTLSRNPTAAHAREASADVSRRGWAELLVPLIWAASSILCFYASATRHAPASWLNAVLGAGLLILFFWDGSRIWGWKLEILPEGLRIQRQFRWSMIPWHQIGSVELVRGWGRNQEAVILKLTSRDSERLGSFDSVFARVLRDRLHSEITRRRG